MSRWSVEEESTVIVDNGSSLIKAGVADTEEPKIVFPSLVGKQKGDVPGDQYVGSDASIRRDILQLSYPIQRGIIQDWDGMENIYGYIYSQLKLDPTRQTIMLSESFNAPKHQKEKIAQMMFETFNVPSLSIQLDAVLGLYPSGLTSGLPVVIGDGLTQALPIFEGIPDPNGLKCQELAGSDITRYLQQSLILRGHSFKSEGEVEALRDVKEKFSYVSLDYNKEMAQSLSDPNLERKYVMPDGTVISVGKERFMCPELIFQPDLIGSSRSSIQDLIHSSIESSDCDLRECLYGNIVPSGGTTCLPGFQDRLNMEIKKLVTKYPVNIFDYPDKSNMVFTGLAIVGASTYYSYTYISKEEYNEYGLDIVHHKTRSVT